MLINSEKSEKEAKEILEVMEFFLLNEWKRVIVLFLFVYLCFSLLML